MTDQKYNVIYADPPWSYEVKKTGRDFKHGAAFNYDLMTNDDIAALPIGQITEKSAVCFMWVTVPLLPEGMATLKAWGFEYKTMITWRKIMSLGMGYWFRGQCEHLILGVKGNVKAFRQQTANFYQSEYEITDDQCVQSKAGKHSQKPGYFRDLISKAVQVSTQKPIQLYRWLFTNYAAPVQKILSPNMGAQSDRIVAYKMGIDFTGTDLSEKHFNDGNKRFKKLTYEPLFY